MTHTLKIMSAQDMPDDDPRKNCRIITGVIEVEMGQNSDGLKTLDYTLEDFLRYTTLMPGNAYLFDSQGQEVHSFGVGQAEWSSSLGGGPDDLTYNPENDTFMEWWVAPNGAIVLQHGDIDSIFGYHVLADVTGLSINDQDVPDIKTLIGFLHEDRSVAEALYDAMSASGLEPLSETGMKAVLDYLDPYDDTDVDLGSDHVAYLGELFANGNTFRLEDVVNTLFDVNKDLHIGSAQFPPTLAAAESWFAISSTPTYVVPAATAEHYVRFCTAWAYGEVYSSVDGLWLNHPFLDTAFYLAPTLEQLHYRIYRAYRSDLSWLDQEPMRSAAE